MTATIERLETTTYTTMAPPSAVDLLAVLRVAVDAVSDADPDELGSRLPAGSELLELAATARRATAYLGGDPGTALTSDVPGVVVVRELVAATRALAAAVPRTSRP